MKTKLLLLSLLVVLTSSCIKDFYGSGGQGKVVLTEENFLYEGDLERIYLNEQISLLDAKIKQASGNEQEELLKQRAELSQSLSEIIDLGQIGIDLVVPCDLPNGKCVPVRLEYFISSIKYSAMLTAVTTSDGQKELASAELSPLVEYGSEVQYTRLPVADFGDQIIVKIAKKDINGKETFYAVTLGK
tara:strand:- start:8720 stop:9283 length:564 start_codon:yes stop_codon:yes gene_type:complete